MFKVNFANYNTLVAFYENRICATLIENNLRCIYICMYLEYPKWTRFGRLTCLKLKNVDCLNNKFCKKYQVCCFGE